MAKLLQFSLFTELAPKPAPAQPLPTPTEPPIPDAAERARALDPQRSFLVEAPAGSGKTGLLIQRLLTLLAGEDVHDPGQVLAITFTRKATAELRERVLRQLQAAAASTPVTNAFDRKTRSLAEAVLARNESLGWRLLEQPTRLNIQTIDGVCAEIVHALPVLAGAGAKPSPTTNPQPLYAEAARRTLNQLGGDDPALDHALAFLLLHRDGNLRDLANHIAQMLGSREQWADLLSRPPDAPGFDFDRLDTDALPKLERALQNAVRTHLEHLASLVPQPLLQEWTDLARSVAQAEDADATPLAPARTAPHPPGTEPRDVDLWLALKHLVITPSGDRWRSPRGLGTMKPKPGPHQKNLLCDLLERLATIDGLDDALAELPCLPPIVYPADQWVVAKALLRVLGHAITELNAVFAARGQSDFPEIALLARRALRNDPDGTEWLGARGLKLRHLLVDEMQDTSSGQYELLDLLTHRWCGDSGETVFLVGDPKQSIYLFRQARVRSFLETLRTGRLGRCALPLEVLRLSTNFRSRTSLVHAFNDDFSAIFAPAAQPTEREPIQYLAAHATREDAGLIPARTFHLTVLPYEPDLDRAAQQRSNQLQATAHLLTDCIAEARQRPLPHGRNRPWRIAVLVRRREDLAGVVAELRERDIPYRAVEIDPLGERQEVLDLLALTRALVHPADRAAWLALLRSPLCGLTLGDLYTLAGGDDPGTARQTLAEAIPLRHPLLSAEGRERLLAFWQVFSRALAASPEPTLAQTVERTWRLFGAPAFASEEQLLNARQFFRLLTEVEADTPPEASLIQTLEQRLGKLFAAPSTVPDAVELLTIHAAKGLEWDTVLVPGLDVPPPVPHGRLLDWIDLDPEAQMDAETARSMFAPIKSKGGPGQKLNQWMGRLERERLSAERKRLFYVACTRAREELHLFATLIESRSQAVKARVNSLLEAAWPAVHPHLPPAGQVIAMPRPLALESLAAAAAPPQPSVLQRIPASAFAQTVSDVADALAANPLPVAHAAFSTRVFGNAVHAYLETLARRLAEGDTPASLLSELPTWTGRIRTLLRAGGLAPDQLEEATTSVLRSLGNTLRSPDGLWLLGARAQASSEGALMLATEDHPVQVRIDRTFLGGAVPGAEGESCRWIVDFKTSSHGSKGLEDWLEEQRALHTEQLNRYSHALALADPARPLRLALFFPALPRLLWWNPADNRSID